eukprot:Anaeramoba_ignava/a218042_19.p1 GENE.a218042_19~~a218042_19.p1  ORF type:complete len:687 (-),score=207.75 a218042_19:59-2119(-)
MNKKIKLIQTFPFMEFNPIFQFPITKNNRECFTNQILQNGLSKYYRKEDNSEIGIGYCGGSLPIRTTKMKNSEKMIPFLFYPKGEISLIMKTIIGKEYIIKVPKNATIMDLKEKLSTVLYVSADNQRMISAGRGLEDGRTISSYRITDNSLIHVVFRLRSCVIEEFSLPPKLDLFEFSQNFFDTHNPIQNDKIIQSMNANDICEWEDDNKVFKLPVFFKEMKLPNKRSNKEYLRIHRGINFYCCCLNPNCEIYNTYFSHYPSKNEAIEEKMRVIHVQKYLKKIQCPKCGSHNFKLEKLYFFSCNVMWEGYKDNLKYFQPWISTPENRNNYSLYQDYDYIYSIPLLQNLDEWGDLKIGISADTYCSLCLPLIYEPWWGFSFKIITCKKCKRFFHHHCFEKWKKKENLEKFFYCPFCKFSLSNDLLKLLDSKKGDFEIISKNGVKFNIFFELLKARLSTKENSDQISKEFLQEIFSQSSSYIVERILKWVCSGFDYVMMNEYTEDDEKEIKLIEQHSNFLEINYETYEQEFYDTLQKIFKCENFKDEFNNKSKYHGILADMKKLYQTESTKDFKIIVEEREIRIHKFILQARSQLYYSMFENVDDPSNSVHDYSTKSFETIRVLFEYFYTNEIPENLSQKMQNELEDVLEYYQLSEDPLQINSSLVTSFFSKLNSSSNPNSNENLNKN